MPDKFLSAATYAAHLGISKRRVLTLCSQGRIAGAVKLGSGTSQWIIPKDTSDPRKRPGRPSKIGEQP